jgi:hypothetical protein
LARLLSELMRDAMLAQGTADGPLQLLTLTHDTFPVPLRFVADLAAVTSRGVPFEPFPFDVQFGDDVEDQLPVPQIVFDNVSRAQNAWAMALEVAPTVLVEVVRISDPSYVEWTMPPVFELQSVEWPDPLTIVGKLGLPDLSVQKHLRIAYTADNYPALSRAV